MKKKSKLPVVDEMVVKIEEVKNQAEQVYVRKSNLVAKDEFDYTKITYKMPGLLECSYELVGEEIAFTYDLKGKKSILELAKETEERKLQVLINIASLYELNKQFQFRLSQDNLFYDENYLVYVKQRDVLGNEQKLGGDNFLEEYKCVVGGVLGDKYTISQLLQSGSIVIKRDKEFEDIIAANSVDEILGLLKKRRFYYIKEHKNNYVEIKKREYSVWKILAIIGLLGFLGFGIWGSYNYYKVTPHLRHLVQANESYITKDYVHCIDSLSNVDVSEMNINTKYILAVSYASTESFKKEEIENIVSKLSLASNEKELEYWINMGRLEVEKAENLAMALSDDKLLIYAYMKEYDLLENNTQIDGQDKKTRLDAIAKEIESLGKKYTVEE